MTQPTLTASSRKSGEDLLVGLCGFVTSLFTAVTLWWVEAQFGFAFYTWMVWFVIPIGAGPSAAQGWRQG